MNPRILVGAAVAALAVAVGAVALSGQAIIDDVSGGGILQGPGAAPAPVLPVEVSLAAVEVEELTGRHADVRVALDVSNPNPRSVLLQLVKYSVYEGGERVHAGEIGEEAGSFVIGSNYYTILPGRDARLSDTFTLRNTGDDQALWEALAGTPDWAVTGEARFSLSSMTAGGENVVEFELAPGA